MVADPAFPWVIDSQLPPLPSFSVPGTCCTLIMDSACSRVPPTPHTHTRSLALFLSHTHSHSNTHSHSHAHTLIVSVSHTHSNTQAHLHAHTHALLFSLSHTHTHSHSRTCSHTHMPSHALSPLISAVRPWALPCSADCPVSWPSSTVQFCLKLALLAPPDHLPGPPSAFPACVNKMCPGRFLTLFQLE